MSDVFFHSQDGKEAGGLCVRTQRNNVGCDSFSRATQTIKKKKKEKKTQHGYGFFFLLNTQNEGN